MPKETIQDLALVLTTSCYDVHRAVRDGMNLNTLRFPSTELVRCADYITNNMLDPLKCRDCSPEDYPSDKLHIYVSVSEGVVHFSMVDPGYDDVVYEKLGRIKRNIENLSDYEVKVFEISGLDIEL